MRQLIWVALFLGLLTPVLAVEERVITYGNDLTPEEKTAVSRDFPLPAGVKLNAVKSITVTNEEEWQLLKGLLPDSEIGTKAISSVYIEKLTLGAGILVTVKNITLITPHMFANALATAGISDVKVAAVSPRLVSGTAALTGMFKSFEEVADRKMASVAKRIAASELIITGKLGGQIGQERAAVLVERAKEQVVSNKAKNSKEDVLKIVEKAAREQNLSLTKEAKDELTVVLVKVQDLNLNAANLRSQLKNFQAEGEKTPPAEPESWIAKIIAFFNSLFNQLFSFVGRILGLTH